MIQGKNDTYEAFLKYQYGKMLLNVEKRESEGQRIIDDIKNQGILTPDNLWKLYFQIPKYEF